MIHITHGRRAGIVAASLETKVKIAAMQLALHNAYLIFLFWVGLPTCSLPPSMDIVCHELNEQHECQILLGFFGLALTFRCTVCCANISGHFVSRCGCA